MKRCFGRGLILVGVLAIFTSCSTPVSEQVAGTDLVEPAHPFTNRLIFEKSPYLLQHAHNPIDWYPWGDEAFEAAREENKPIFLSIGYSTCHWCHVMEEESFENEEIAALLNEHFVAIKVDREERPDIDSYFMTVSQIITGRGGWPLNIIMTPEKEPFFAATYIPPTSVQGRIGMMELLPAVTSTWQDRAGDVLATAASVMEALESVVTADLTGAGLSEAANRSGFEKFRVGYDPEYGGFGGSQKFPATHNLLFLLRYWNRTGEEAARLMAETTLTNMRLGGIFDHVGFGFHRYSTDRAWHLPHFEKMLYDQAMLAAGYVEGYLATGDSFFRQTAEEIFTYVLRDMLSPEGGFYSAEDADSEGEEGLFYLWSRDDVEELLGADAGAAIAAFGIATEGNYIDEALGTRTSLNVLARTSAPIPQQWEEVRRKLFAHREGRIRPLLDDKILTDWNGLMISALANGSRAFRDPELLLAAKKAADFILENMVGAGGELYHRYREGEASIPGQLADYGFFVHGLIDLYQASRDVRYLEYSVSLTDTMLELFLDTDSGGFFMTSGESGDLRFRQKKSADGALPSGNSVAFGVLLRLSWLTGNTGYSDHAADTGRAFSRFLEQAPDGHGMFLAFHELLLMEPVEVLVVGKPDAPETIAMLEALDRVYAPNMTVIFKPASETASPLDRVAPFTSGYIMIKDTATAYVCRDFVCNLPTTDISQMLGQIREEIKS